MSSKETIFLFMVFSVSLWCLWMYIQRKPSRATGSIDAIVPAYNEENCIENTLISLLKNRYIHRVICVNDGSTDDTPKIIDAMVASGIWGDNLQVVHQSNTGKGGALMRGISCARSAVVFLTDADTFIPDDDGLGYLLTEIEAGADAVGGICDVNLQDAGWLAYMRASVKAPIVVLQRGFQQLLGGAPFIISGGCGLFKREIFLKHGFSDRTKVEDLDLSWTLVKNGYNIRVAPRCVVYTQECRYIRDEWKKYKRWIVGYAVCMRLHKDLLLTRFGFGSILFAIFSVFFGIFVILEIIWGFISSEKSVDAIFSLLFPWTWMGVLLVLASVQAVRHRNALLIPTVPLTIPHLLMTYAVWLTHGIAGFFTGREPERDKPTRYVQFVSKIKQQMHVQTPGILHFEIHHLAHGKGCLMFAIDNVTQWMSALHVPDNSQASFSKFFQHCLGHYPVKIKKMVSFNNIDGQEFQKNIDVQQFCRLTGAECIFVQAQSMRKNIAVLLHNLQQDSCADMNKNLQTILLFHNQQLPMEKMQSWYEKNPKIFIVPPIVRKQQLANFPLENMYAQWGNIV